MLVLSRKTRQQIQIGDNVVVTILLVKGNTVRVGIEAPRDVRVLRAELPLHEQDRGEEQSRTQPPRIAAETNASPAAEVRSPNPTPKSTMAQRAESAKGAGPVLEALRRRGGLGALARRQPQADASDTSPIFDHH